MAEVLFSFIGLREWKRKLIGEDNYKTAKILISTLRKYREQFNKTRKLAIYNIKVRKQENILGNPMMHVEQYRNHLQELSSIKLSLDQALRSAQDIWSNKFLAKFEKNLHDSFFYLEWSFSLSIEQLGIQKLTIKNQQYENYILFDDEITSHKNFINYLFSPAYINIEDKFGKLVNKTLSECVNVCRKKLK